jgi:hypothetical protein
VVTDACWYCGRPAFVYWDVDLVTCSHEQCETLAFAEMARRARRGNGAPEKRLERALVHALTTFERELRMDRDAELLEPAEARRIGRHEREETARVIGELHELVRGGYRVR